MRKTPCESTPRRFAQMSDFAHSSAMAGATPAATNNARAKRSSSALEITCDPVFGGIGALQQFSRRARVAPDLYTKALAEQQSRIALRRAWAMRAMVGLCRPTANGTMRASAQTRGMRVDPQLSEGHDRRNPFRRAAQLGGLGQWACRFPDPEP